MVTGTERDEIIDLLVFNWKTSRDRHDKREERSFSVISERMLCRYLATATGLLLHRKLALFNNFQILFNRLLIYRENTRIHCIRPHSLSDFIWLQTVRQALVEDNGVPTRAFMKSFRYE